MLNAILTQVFNGVQYGMLLFLTAAGLTLVFGVMNFVNLAHGSLYMLGAYVGATVATASGSLLVGVAAAVVVCFVLGALLERFALSRLYGSDHLYHVLATFGLILFFNELARIIWGEQPVYASVPQALSGIIHIGGVRYPAYSLAVIVSGLVVALGIYLLISRTRMGMLIRAGATHPQIVEVMGVNIRVLKTLLFAVGAALAGFAGAILGPLVSVQSGMGEPVLITTLVVIVVGGVGSVRGAFGAALLVGIVDTLARTFLPLILSASFSPGVADTAAPALASMMVYILMAIVLIFRPNGIFGKEGS